MSLLRRAASSLVHLHGDHPGSPLAEELREEAGAGPDLDDDVCWLQLGRLHYASQRAAVDQEVLA